MHLRCISFAALFFFCVASANAGTVTWEFVETSGGTIGGFLTLNSPPVDLTPGAAWTATTTDVVSFSIADANIGPVGTYDLNLNVASILEGIGPDFINTHEVSGQNAAGDVAFSNISVTSNASDLGVGLASGGGGSVNGNWVLMPAAVPEPSSLVLSSIAALAGAGAWTRKPLKRR
jgi:hypothetical protein